MTHVCNLWSAWPIGHPLPPINEDKLSGPEVGSVHDYVSKYPEQSGTAVVLERSYVWSPGECQHNGGYRSYDWSVIEVTAATGKFTIVVNDSDLS